MARATSFCGVILAAGESSRMGRAKALLPWQQGTFLSGAIRLLASQTDLVIVVAGRNSEELKPTIYGEGASLVINNDPDRGQLSSLQAGLQDVLHRGRDAAIFTLVDRPPVREETLVLLKQAFIDNPSAWAVIPELGGRHGHPIVIGIEFMSRFLGADQGSSARDIIHSNIDRVLYLPVTDPAATMNINTP